MACPGMEEIVSWCLSGQAVVWTTWAIIAALLLLASMVFNLFPDYSSPHSWCALSLLLQIHQTQALRNVRSSGCLKVALALSKPH